ncbi:MAG: pilus assembly protein TadG [Alphaproteobacteria bacterium]|nr:pilus assembly protein TadG [Alphaproteobacteria bacterium]
MIAVRRLLRRPFARLVAATRRLRGDDRGAVAVQFAFLALPIAVLAFGLLDMNRISVQRHQLQDALDAATLIAARSTATTDAALDTTGDAAFLAEISGLNMGLTAADATFKAGTDNHVLGAATATVKPIIANLWTSKDVTVTATSDVVRSSKNLEVAVVLDITGSMSGTRISDLKTGASDLVDIIVKDIQTPYYSKVAIVPYSNAVNVDTYADAVRGAVPVRNISGAAWASATKTITGISKANNAVVTSNGHGFAVGNYVYISGISGNATTGMAALNGNIYSISAKTTNTFTLSGANTSLKSSYGSGGTATKCATSACSLVITTSTAHGFITGDDISFAGMSGLTSLNGTTQTITSLTTTTFDTGLYGPGTATYTSGGTATCDTSTVEGCANFVFTSAAGSGQTQSLSTCVSERTGSDAYTDAAPSTALVGRAYPAASGNNPCPTATIMPLSSDRTALKAKISSLAAAGSTAGQIGLAWGWYMIAPNFSYLWPNAVQKPAAYKTKDLVKVVVLMTDGAFNTPYCSGVIAKDAGSGSGNSSDHINCNATNGDPFTQAKKVCDAIKASANGITLYTVGFDVGTDATAVSMLKYCATDADHVYFPANGSELKTAFKSIAQDISSLRIAK